MVKYIMRPHASVASKLRQLKQQYRLGEYQNDEPVVGVHMRRTDKLIKEAGFFSIQEYMIHVSLSTSDAILPHSRTVLDKDKSLLKQPNSGRKISCIQNSSPKIHFPAEAVDKLT